MNLIEEFAKDIIHQMLKNKWCIGKSRIHDIVFKMNISYSE